MRVPDVFFNLPITKHLLRSFGTQRKRDAWVSAQLARLPSGARLLDAGCGSQRYRKYCDHLNYLAQDFGGFTDETKATIGIAGGNTSEPPRDAESVKHKTHYEYGVLDYKSDLWSIPEKDGYFDAVLCTEVFEHVPYPIDSIKEFSRLLKPGGTLILTAPSSCLRHMDPYFFYSGFSDRWHEKILSEHGFVIREMEQVGDYYSWMGYEVAKTGMSHSLFAKIMLFPAFLYYTSKKPTQLSRNTMCFAYQIVAVRS